MSRFVFTCRLIGARQPLAKLHACEATLSASIEDVFGSGVCRAGRSYGVDQVYRGRAYRRFELNVNETTEGCLDIHIVK